MVGLKPLPAQTIEHQRSEDVSEKGYELLTITNIYCFIILYANRLAIQKC